MILRLIDDLLLLLPEYVSNERGNSLVRFLLSQLLLLGLLHYALETHRKCAVPNCLRPLRIHDPLVLKRRPFAQELNLIFQVEILSIQLLNQDHLPFKLIL